MSASSGLILQVGSPPATGVTISPVSPWTGSGAILSYPQADVPAAAGSMVGALSVIPSGWSGTLALSGTSASLFALSGNNLIVGASALPAGSYNVTVTATP